MTKKFMNGSTAATAVASSRVIRAIHDNSTVRVYQAYNDPIANAVLETQSFREAANSGLWSPKRMTWIKPSKVWMAYRCGWTVWKDANQSRVLALDIDRFKFEELLAQATLSRHKKSEKKKCRASGVVVQWDPERVMTVDVEEDDNSTCTTTTETFTRSTAEVRSIQIGLRPPANECLMDSNVVKCITDVTEDFRKALKALQQGNINDATRYLWPDDQTETLLTMPDQIQANLAMTTTTVSTKNHPPTVGTKKKNAVVVLGCTANPPHQGHLHCVREASLKASEELGYNVLFSTIAVAPFGYVKSKMKKKEHSDDDASLLLLDDATRLRILDLTAAAMKANEHQSFVFHVPLRTYGSALECGRALRPSDDVTVIVVVGGDRFKWTKPNHSDLVTLCCARSDEQLKQLQGELERDIDAGLVSDPSKWQIMSSIGPSTSSTLIRTILLDSEKTLEQKQVELKEHGYPDEAAELLVEITNPT